MATDDADVQLSFPEENAGNFHLIALPLVSCGIAFARHDTVAAPAAVKDTDNARR
jgi:hypothetical protein